MLTNYLKIAWRNLWRERVYTIINLLGLGVGMACALLAVLFVRNELNYDQFHAQTPQLYRLTTTIVNNDGQQKRLGASGQVQGPAFKQAIPEVTEYARILGVKFNVIGQEKSLALQGLFADASFPNLFSFPLLHGNWPTALTNSNSIVIREDIARKFFGKTDVVGELLTIEDGDHLEPFVITQIILIAAGLSILICCIGLFGLARMDANQRTKEIGVRKVLGATVFSIVTLLSKDFLKLVVVAIVIASPLAYYAMHRWLADFAYKIDITWWVFALAGLLAVGIALLTVSFQSVKAALMNPVKSLRSE